MGIPDADSLTLWTSKLLSSGFYISFLLGYPTLSIRIHNINCLIYLLLFPLSIMLLYLAASTSSKDCLPLTFPINLCLMNGSNSRSCASEQLCQEMVNPIMCPDLIVFC